MLRRAGWAHFNSRPSARGDASCTLQIVSLTRFQFTPLREGRLSRYTFDNDLPDISIHAPPRGATTAPAILSNSYLFQFTPLREGRLSRYTFDNDLPDISIHAPPRGATTAPAILSNSYLFQFTPLREGRLTQKNATHGRRYFNSRPSARGDRVLAVSATCSINFNSRPSARGDGRCTTTAKQTAYFNSRPSARGDGSKMLLKTGIFISIHAPPRGATSYTAAGNGRSLFQFTPLREGRRRYTRLLLGRQLISIHAPPRGAT